MKTIAHSLLVVGLSCWFLGGCVGTDMDDTGEALAQAEDAYEEHEAFSDSEEDLSDSEIQTEGEYSTEICSGFSGSGSACQVKCSNGAWYTVGYYPNITDCTSAGNWFCASWGMYGVGHCWN